MPHISGLTRLKMSGFKDDLGAAGRASVSRSNYDAIALPGSQARGVAKQVRHQATIRAAVLGSRRSGLLGLRRFTAS